VIAKCDFLENTIFYKGRKDWNDIPYEIRNSQSLEKLKPYFGQQSGNF
jgi:hypothetical protein